MQALPQLNIEVSVTFCHASKTNFILFFSSVFFCILFSFLIDDSSFFLQGLLSFDCGDGSCRFHTFQVLLSFQNCLRDCRDSCVGHCQDVCWSSTLISVTICSLIFFICPH